ncbi:hypothetical protein D3C85_1614360 [compost metagenome]
MAKNNKKTPVAEPAIGVNPEVVAAVVVETPVVSPAVITPVVTEIETHEAELIPSGIFVAESGDEYEFTVGSFMYKGGKFTKEEALSNHPEVLEHLISLKSFILKKK